MPEEEGTATLARMAARAAGAEREGRLPSPPPAPPEPERQRVLSLPQPPAPSTQDKLALRHQQLKAVDHISGAGTSPSASSTATPTSSSPVPPASSSSSSSSSSSNHVATDAASSSSSSGPMNPIDRAGLLSILYLSCLDGLIALGTKRPLQESDVPPCPSGFQCHTLKDHMAATATKMMMMHSTKGGTATAGGRVRFSAVLWRAFYLRWLVAFCCSMVFVTCMFLQPFWLGGLLAWMSDKAAGRYVQGVDYFMGASTGYELAAGLVITTFIAMTGTNHAFYHMALYSLALRSSIMVAVYEKSMRLSPEARRKHTTGSITTMMAVDSERVYQGAFTSQWLWMGPTVILGSTILTVRVLGIAGLVGAVLTTLSLLFQYVMAKKSAKARDHLVGSTDERVKLTNEVLQGIRVIKMYCWEKPIRGLVDEVRKKEVRSLAWLLMVKLTAIVTLFVAPTLISVLTFTVYFAINAGEEVRLDRVFAALAFMNIIRLPMSSMPQAASNFADLRVAIKRIDRFMDEQELVPHHSLEAAEGSGTQEKHSRQDGGDGDGDDDVVISINRGNFTWDGADTTRSGSLSGPTLRDINLQVKKRQLVCIVGPVGAGKSSLVSAILGDIHCLSGHTTLRGKVAYVSQEAWIQNKTLKDCILFDRPYHSQRYRKAVKAAQLQADLAMLPSEDGTEIGERGINLSGGQKARVSLARALNESGADIFIFDDPLSAVDAHVGKAIFQKALLGILGSKTRLLVLSSNYHFLPFADSIVIMEQGRIIAAGSFSELVGLFPRYFREKSEGGDGKEGRLSSRALSTTSKGAACGSMDDDEGDDEEGGEGACGGGGGDSAVAGVAVAGAGQEEEGGGGNEQQFSSPPQPSPPLLLTSSSSTGKLMGAEEREVGKVSWSVYVEYFRGAAAASSHLGGAALAITTVGLFLLGQGLRVSVDYLLAHWSEQARGWDAEERESRYTHYTVLYWVLCLLTLLVTLARTVLLIYVAIKSCSQLHTRLLDGVLRAPVNKYFDITPIGRILNRFSKDLDAVDQPLPETMLQFLQNIAFVLSILVLCMMGTPWFTLCLVPILALFLLVYHFFQKTSRELKRLEGISRSPIYSSFGEMLQGIETIRAFHRTDEFLAQHLQRVDKNASLYVLFWLTARWFAIRLDFLAVLIMLTVSFFAAVLVEHQHGGGGGGQHHHHHHPSSSDGSGGVGAVVVSPAGLSLALVYCLQLTGLLQWTIRLLVETENYMTAVERLTAFLQLPSEAPTITDVRPPEAWPDKGAIEIKDLRLRYRDGLDLILRGLNLSIKGGEKVGVCGRTGAGKSSLTQALFRMVEAEEGSIIIDGVDISTIGLDDLRSRLTIIPQDPLLFSGSLRQNLDPFNERTDHEIWEALRRVSLDQDVGSLPHQLATTVSEKGGNFSLGQRQLLCIGRALLRRYKILVMDEATASVDTETDRHIQETIRSNFGSCTVICIAHRLDTIMDFDRVAVMDNGVVVEYDHPAVLLAMGEGEGVFRGMVEQLGREVGERMRRVAEESLARRGKGGM